MTAFALRCDDRGVILEIIGEAPSVFDGCIGQLFSANRNLVDIKKALNFYLGIKNNIAETGWELSFSSEAGAAQYVFSGFLYRDDIFLIGEKSSYEPFEDLNRINIEFSDMIRSLTREKVASKRQFMETASHELRTPNTVISGYLEMVLENYQGSIPDEAYSWLKVVMDNAKRLERITDGLLELEQIESGLLEPNRNWIRFERLYEEVLEAKQGVIDDKGMRLDSRVMAGEVYVDREMIFFVMDALIDNAAKFGEDDTVIKVTAERTGEELLVSVRDRGVTVEPMYLDDVFLPFEHIPKPTYYVGVGISLSLCKAYIELHGGSIWMEPVDDGVMVSFRIPVID